MYVHARATIFFFLLLGGVAGALAQSPSKTSREPTGVIIGRVTIDRKAAPGVVVGLQPSELNSPRVPAAKATTDEEGRFRLVGVASGRYRLMPLALTLVASSQGGLGLSGKMVTVSEGETIEGIELELTRGGVITGRITDAEGWPVIEAPVTLSLLDGQGQKHSYYSFNPHLLKTDDRGVYRVYGLPTGRYLVSVGEGSGNSGPDGGYYPRTFYPNVTDEARAMAVEVTAGGEVRNIDIKLGQPSRGYVASGRIIDAGSGRPASNAPYGYSDLGAEMRGAKSGFRASSEGEFRIEGLSPGRYAVFVNPEGGADAYSDPVTFEVTDGDVNGLEVLLRHGSSISGTAVVEGTNDPNVLTGLGQVELVAFEVTSDLSMPHTNQAKVSPNGSFHFTGLRPGLTKISLPGAYARQGFSLLRVERHGVEQREGITVAPGEQVTGVSLVFAYGTGVVRGQVKTADGTLPEGMQLRVSYRPASGVTSHNILSVPVDALGRFVIEGLTAGVYELTLNVTTVSASGAPASPYQPMASQTVTVRNGTESTVTLALDARLKGKEGDQ